MTYEIIGFDLYRHGELREQANNAEYQFWFERNEAREELQLTLKQVEETILDLKTNNPGLALTRLCVLRDKLSKSLEEAGLDPLLVE